MSETLDKLVVEIAKDLAVVPHDVCELATDVWNHEKKFVDDNEVVSDDEKELLAAQATMIALVEKLVKQNGLVEDILWLYSSAICRELATKCDIAEAMEKLLERNSLENNH